MASMLGELHRTGRACGVLVAAAVVLSGCSILGGDKEAEEYAERVAKALTDRDISAVSSAADQKDLARVLTGAGGHRAEVTAGDVEVDGSSAKATLHWTWRTSGQAWRYTSTATLRKTGEAWHLAWSPSAVEPSLKGDETLELTDLHAKRGEITGAGGAVLVTERPVRRIGIDKTQLKPEQAADAARRLAALVDIDPAAYAKTVAAAGPRAFVQALVLRQADAGQVDQLALSQIPGAVALSAELPLGPSKRFAAPLLGTVGPATAEVVKKSKGRIRAGDVTGLSGLQLRYDAQLAGTDGVLVEARDPNGPDRQLFEKQPVDGKPLALSLDPAMQTEAEDALEGVPSASALVAIKPSTGQVVAAASGPGSKGYNTATFAQYAPGSTFKVVTSLALLRAGLTPESDVDCSPTVNVSGKSFKNYDDYPSDRLGSITLRTAVANSCNTGLISARGKLKPNDLTDAAQALGVGRRPGRRLPGVLRSGARAGQRDREGRRHDRPGQGARLADGDGRGRRIGREG